MKTLEKLRKQEVGEYEKILAIIEKISTRKITCTVMTNELTEELRGLKQMQDFCYNQIDKFDEWAKKQSKLIGEK